LKKRKVLVIDKKKLFELLGYFQGFKQNLETNIIHKLEKRAIWLDKEEAEKNYNFKQLVGYTVIYYPSKYIFAYKRATDNNYEERRLQGKWSWGIGGHIEKCDSESPVFLSTLREIKEEVEIIDDISQPKLLGFINDDSNDVGKVHFGLLLYCELSSPFVKPKDPEIDCGGLMTIEELYGIRNNLNTENWSIIALPILKDLIV